MDSYSLNYGVSQHKHQPPSRRHSSPGRVRTLSPHQQSPTSNHSSYSSSSSHGKDSSRRNIKSTSSSPFNRHSVSHHKSEYRKQSERDSDFRNLSEKYLHKLCDSSVIHRSEDQQVKAIYDTMQTNHLSSVDVRVKSPKEPNSKQFSSNTKDISKILKDEIYLKLKQNVSDPRLRHSTSSITEKKSSNDMKPVSRQAPVSTSKHQISGHHLQQPHKEINSSGLKLPASKRLHVVPVKKDRGSVFAKDYTKTTDSRNQQIEDDLKLQKQLILQYQQSNALLAHNINALCLLNQHASGDGSMKVSPISDITPSSYDLKIGTARRNDINSNVIELTEVLKHKLAEQLRQINKPGKPAAPPVGNQLTLYQTESDVPKLKHIMNNAYLNGVASASLDNISCSKELVDRSNGQSIQLSKKQETPHTQKEIVGSRHPSISTLTNSLAGPSQVRSDEIMQQAPATVNKEETKGHKSNSSIQVTGTSTKVATSSDLMLTENFMEALRKRTFQIKQKNYMDRTKEPCINGSAISAVNQMKRISQQRTPSSLTKPEVHKLSLNDYKRRRRSGSLSETPATQTIQSSSGCEYKHAVSTNCKNVTNRTVEEKEGVAPQQQRPATPQQQLHPSTMSLQQQQRISTMENSQYPSTKEHTDVTNQQQRPSTIMPQQQQRPLVTLLQRRPSTIESSQVNQQQRPSTIMPQQQQRPSAKLLQQRPSTIESSQVTSEGDSSVKHEILNDIETEYEAFIQSITVSSSTKEKGESLTSTVDQLLNEHEKPKLTIQESKLEVDTIRQFIEQNDELHGVDEKEDLMKTVEDQTQLPNKWACNECGKLFSFPQSLQRHKKNVHKRRKSVLVARNKSRNFSGNQSHKAENFNDALRSSADEKFKSKKTTITSAKRNSENSGMTQHDHDPFEFPGASPTKVIKSSGSPFKITPSTVARKHSAEFEGSAYISNSQDDHKSRQVEVKNSIFSSTVTGKRQHKATLKKKAFLEDLKSRREKFEKNTKRKTDENKEAAMSTPLKKNVVKKKKTNTSKRKQNPSSKVVVKEVKTIKKPPSHVTKNLNDRTHSSKSQNDCPSKIRNVSVSKTSEESITKELTFDNIVKTVVNTPVPTVRKKFKCKICSTEFLKEQELEKHSMMHKGRTYDCYKCSEKFVTMRALTKHLVIHDENEVRVVSSDRPHVCEKCSENFETENQLLVHLLIHERKEIEHVCAICSAKYQSLSELYSHVAKSHPEDMQQILRCVHCDQSFRKLNDFRQHLIVTHKMNSKEASLAVRNKGVIPDEYKKAEEERLQMIQAKKRTKGLLLRSGATVKINHSKKFDKNIMKSKRLPGSNNGAVSGILKAKAVIQKSKRVKRALNQAANTRSSARIKDMTQITEKQQVTQTEERIAIPVKPKNPLKPQKVGLHRQIDSVFKSSFATRKVQVQPADSEQNRSKKVNSHQDHSKKNHSDKNHSDKSHSKYQTSEVKKDKEGSLQGTSLLSTTLLESIFERAEKAKTTEGKSGENTGKPKATEIAGKRKIDETSSTVGETLVENASKSQKLPVRKAHLVQDFMKLRQEEEEKRTKMRFENAERTARILIRNQRKSTDDNQTVKKGRRSSTDESSSQSLQKTSPKQAPLKLKVHIKMADFVTHTTAEVVKPSAGGGTIEKKSVKKSTRKKRNEKKNMTSQENVTSQKNMASQNKFGSKGNRSDGSRKRRKYYVYEDELYAQRALLNQSIDSGIGSTDGSIENSSSTPYEESDVEYFYSMPNDIDYDKEFDYGKASMEEDAVLTEDELLSCLMTLSGCDVDPYARRKIEEAHHRKITNDVKTKLDEILENICSNDESKISSSPDSGPPCSTDTTIFSEESNAIVGETATIGGETNDDGEEVNCTGGDSTAISGETTALGVLLPENTNEKMNAIQGNTILNINKCYTPTPASEHDYFGFIPHYHQSFPSDIESTTPMGGDYIESTDEGESCLSKQCIDNCLASTELMNVLQHEVHCVLLDLVDNIARSQSLFVDFIVSDPRKLNDVSENHFFERSSTIDEKPHAIHCDLTNIDISAPNNENSCVCLLDDIQQKGDKNAAGVHMLNGLSLPDTECRSMKQSNSIEKSNPVFRENNQDIHITSGLVGLQNSTLLDDREDSDLCSKACQDDATFGLDISSETDEKFVVQAVLDELCSKVSEVNVAAESDKSVVSLEESDDKHVVREVLGDLCSKICDVEISSNSVQHNRSNHLKEYTDSVMSQKIVGNHSAVVPQTIVDVEMSVSSSMATKDSDNIEESDNELNVSARLSSNAKNFRESLFDFSRNWFKNSFAKDVVCDFTNVKIKEEPIDIDLVENYIPYANDGSEIELEYYKNSSPIKSYVSKDALKGYSKTYCNRQKSSLKTLSFSNATGTMVPPIDHPSNKKLYSCDKYIRSNQSDNENSLSDIYPAVDRFHAEGPISKHAETQSPIADTVSTSIRCPCTSVKTLQTNGIIETLATRKKPRNPNGTLKSAANKLYSCPLCSIVSDRLSSYQTHMLRHHDIVMRHKCKNCGKLHKNPKKHLCKSEPFTCSSCKRKYQSRKNLLRHQLLVVHKRIDLRNRCKCPRCGRVFNRLSYLALHMQCHKTVS